MGYDTLKRKGNTSLGTVLSYLTVIPLGALLALFAISTMVQRFPEHVMKETENTGEPYDIFMISSYYYPRSKSLGENAVALVVTGDYNAYELDTVAILAWNETHNAIDIAKIKRITPHNVCRWISMQISGNTLPNMNKMALIVGKQYVEVPFNAPVFKKHDVVTCIAPLFANEQWQYAVFAAHTYRRFGTHMHMYIRSMVSPVFNMLKEYEKEGYLTMQPWLRIRLKTVSETVFNPNINIEFRNQAAAQTDCLLKYKESASFIAFMDLDDILIPRLGKNYFEEFVYLFNSLPNVASIHYGKENVEVKGIRNPSEFSIAQMYSSIRFKQQSETGKFVTKPELINSTWIHWPNELPEGMERYDVPLSENVITHLKYMEDDRSRPDSKTIRLPIFEPRSVTHNETNYLLSREDIEWMQRDLDRMKELPNCKLLWNTLPTKFFYFNIILKCFNDTYYRFHYSGQMNKLKCPGPERCNFPMAPGFNCSNSIADYFSTKGHTLFNIHYTMNAHFRIEDGCRP